MKALKRSQAFEVRLYMGSRKGYGEEQYASHHVVRAISEFQQSTKSDEPPIPVRLTPTTFVSKDYVEEGWEIRDVLHEVLGERVSSVGEALGRSDDAFLLSSREAAERLAISQGQLYHMTKAGVLPCVRVGRLVRYSTDTIQQWIRNTESGEVVVPPARRTTPAWGTTIVPFFRSRLSTWTMAG